MSGNEVAMYEEITAVKVMEYLDSAGITDSLLPHEKKMFINMAREMRLNPFKREIHITAYGKGEYRKCSIITGYEVYIKRAELSGKLDGWKVWTDGEGKNLKAVVEIYRKDQKYPFIHEVYFVEVCQYNKEGHPNAIWAKQPRFMTKKVAIGQAFRLCFPDDLAGMPYEEAEIPPDEQEPRNVTEGQGGSSTITTGQQTTAADVTPQQYTDGINELKNIMLSEDDSHNRYFTDDEYNEVKATLAGLKGKPKEEKWATLSKLLEEKKNELQTMVESNNNDGFTDDGFDDENPENRELETVNAGADQDELDIF